MNYIGYLLKSSKVIIIKVPLRYMVAGADLMKGDPCGGMCKGCKCVT